MDFEPDHDTLYPVTIAITAIDRYHLFIDIVECITNTLRLTMNSFNTHTVDSIVTITINFSVHSAREVETIIHHVEKIDGVDEVKRISDSNK